MPDPPATSPLWSDLRVETVSIVALLAGYEEFALMADPVYHADILAHFSPHKDHPMIGFARRIRQENDIAYNAVPAIAVHLSQPPAFEPLVPFALDPPEERWNEEISTEFARLLREFYRDADCETFFADQQEYYRHTEAAVRPIFARLDTDWFEHFFGYAQQGALYPIIGMCQGGHNYGAELTWPDGVTDMFALMGIWAVDEKTRMPEVDADNYLSTIVHEFAHGFVNPMNERHLALLQPAGEKIYQTQQNIMQRQSYTDWLIMFHEALVRTIEINYALAHDNPEQALYTIVEDIGSNGFIWIKELADLLEADYLTDRDTYPDMDRYMPHIAAFYNRIAEDFPSYMAARLPQVETIAPFVNGAQDVDPQLGQITVRFDRPLIGRGMSVAPRYGREYPIPPAAVYEYSEDNRSITFGVTLQPDTEYAFTLTGLAFRTPEDYPIAPYTLTFKTRNNNP